MEDIRKYKTACILIDDEDLVEFKCNYKSEFREDMCWFPVAFTPMIQVILEESERSYFLPKMELEKDCWYHTREIYNSSQDFLKSLFEHNKCLDNKKDTIQFFPLEYYWHCVFAGVFRIVSFCQSLLKQCRVDDIFIIWRDNLINHGGLEVNDRSYTSVIKEYFESKGVKVKLFPSVKGHSGSKVNFLYGTPTWKSKIKRILMFSYWKYKSFRGKNYNYLLINPSYDNKINFLPPFIYPGASMPQVFFERGIPFFHEFRNIIGFYKGKKKLDKIIIPPGYNEISYSFTMGDFQCDIANLFSTTIERYLNDIAWMKKYVDLWWSRCPHNEQLKTVIFSAPPVFMYSWFLIKKIKENQGKVVTWQHGGFYGSADHFVQYFTDYKLSDIFLSYGKSHADDMGRLIGENCNKSIEIGSNYFFPIKTKKERNNKKRTDTHSKGLFIPAVMGTFYSQSRIKWDGPLQFQNIKKIIEILSSGRFGKVTIKGLRNHKPHLEIQKHIIKNNIQNIDYTDGSVDNALSIDPGFVLFDAPSTPLIEVLTRYSGVVFVLNCQESWKIYPEALSLLKRRILYSESIDQLEKQMITYLLNNTNIIPLQDNSFIDSYVKHFSYEKYQRFLASIEGE